MITVCTVLHSYEFKGCLFTEQSCDDVDGLIKPKTIYNSYCMPSSYCILILCQISTEYSTRRRYRISVPLQYNTNGMYLCMQAEVLAHTWLRTRKKNVAETFQYVLYIMFCIFIAIPMICVYRFIILYHKIKPVAKSSRRWGHDYCVSCVSNVRGYWLDSICSNSGLIPGFFRLNGTRYLSKNTFLEILSNVKALQNNFFYC